MELLVYHALIGCFPDPMMLLPITHPVKKDLDADILSGEDWMLSKHIHAPFALFMMSQKRLKEHNPPSKIYDYRCFFGHESKLLLG